MLTWAGEKLRPEWAVAFIGGKIAYKPRPYLRARMPAWPSRAEGLAKGLAAEHGYSPATPKYPAPDETLAATGQKLIGAAGGFSCVQCHAVGTQPPLAPFEAPALDFAYVSDRLRKEHYLRWVFNPIKVDPATKMPAFADADGKSALRDVFDGDAGKQFESIWQFLLRGKDVKAPGQ
jgi:mono/diheme cytochrome c family protein